MKLEEKYKVLEVWKSMTWSEKGVESVLGRALAVCEEKMAGKFWSIEQFQFISSLEYYAKKFGLYSKNTPES